MNGLTPEDLVSRVLYRRGSIGFTDISYTAIFDEQFSAWKVYSLWILLKLTKNMLRNMFQPLYRHFGLHHRCFLWSDGYFWIISNNKVFLKSKALWELFLLAILTEFFFIYLKGIKFRGYYILRFSRFLTIFAKFCTRVKFQNYKIPKVNTREIKYLASLNSLVLNIWSKYDIDTRISRFSTDSNEIRVSVTYLITITLINNRKSDI